MTLASETFDIDAGVVFRDKPMRVMGRIRLEGASGQVSIRYFLSDGEGAPVLLEQVAGARYALLRPFPPAARPPTAGNTFAVKAAAISCRFSPEP